MTANTVLQGQPIPALQGIGASNRVVYVGTFAKILFPAMRLGFMVAPKANRANDRADRGRATARPGGRRRAMRTS